MGWSTQELSFKVIRSGRVCATSHHTKIDRVFHVSRSRQYLATESNSGYPEIQRYWFLHPAFMQLSKGIATWLTTHSNDLPYLATCSGPSSYNGPSISTANRGSFLIEDVIRLTWPTGKMRAPCGGLCWRCAKPPILGHTRNSVRNIVYIDALIDRLDDFTDLSRRIRWNFLGVEGWKDGSDSTFRCSPRSRRRPLLGVKTSGGPWGLKVVNIRTGRSSLCSPSAQPAFALLSLDAF